MDGGNIAVLAHISRVEEEVAPRILFGGKCASDVSPDIPTFPRRLRCELKAAMADMAQGDAYSSILVSRQARGADRPMYSALSIYLGGTEYERADA